MSLWEVGWGGVSVRITALGRRTASQRTWRLLVVRNRKVHSITTSDKLLAANAETKID